MPFFRRTLVLCVCTLLLIGSGCRNNNTTDAQQHVNTPELQETNTLLQHSAPWDIELYNGFYERAGELPRDVPKISGGIVPHHLIAGHTIARFFETAAINPPSLVVLIGPNHLGRGSAPLQTSARDWTTPYGTLGVAAKPQHDLIMRGILTVNETTLAEEHSVYSIMPFVRRSLPDARVLPIVVRNDTSEEELDTLVRALHEVLPMDALIVGSIDFSHYQTLAVANFHDELSTHVIRTLDLNRIAETEIDAPATLYAMLSLMAERGTGHVAYMDHTNSAGLVHDPSAEVTTSHIIPYFVKGAPHAEAAISMLFFGDLMMDRSVKKTYEANGGPEYIFSKLAGQENRFFSGVDVISANLEGPLADVRIPTTKEIAFRFDPKLTRVFTSYGFTHFTLANNHTYDMGKSGVADTQRHLDAAGIAWYGDEFTISSSSLRIDTIGSQQVAFIGFNDTHAQLDEPAALALIRYAEAIADITVMNIHWGVEYQPLSHPRQQYLAHIFADAGADLIIGHHPHVVQEMELYGDVPIFYSLGNFVFDQYFSLPTQQSLAVGVVFHEDELSLYTFPLQGIHSQVQLMPYEQAVPFMQNFVDRSLVGSYTFRNFHVSIPVTYDTARTTDK